MVTTEKKVASEARLYQAVLARDSRQQILNFQESLVNGKDSRTRWGNISIATFYRTYVSEPINAEPPKATFKTGPYVLGYTETAWNNGGDGRKLVKMVLDIKSDSGDYLRLFSFFGEDSIGNPLYFLEGSAIARKDGVEYEDTQEAFDLASSMLETFVAS